MTERFILGKNHSAEWMSGSFLQIIYKIYNGLNKKGSNKIWAYYYFLSLIIDEYSIIKEEIIKHIYI